MAGHKTRQPARWADVRRWWGLALAFLGAIVVRAVWLGLGGGGLAPQGTAGWRVISGALLGALLAPAAAAVALRIAGSWAALAAAAVVIAHTELIRHTALPGPPALLALLYLALVGAWLAQRTRLAAGVAGLAPWVHATAWAVGLAWLAAHWREARPSRPWAATGVFGACALPLGLWLVWSSLASAPPGDARPPQAPGPAEAVRRASAPEVQAQEPAQGAPRVFLARAAQRYAERGRELIAGAVEVATPPLLALAAIGAWLASRRRCAAVSKLCTPLAGVVLLPLGPVASGDLVPFVPILAVLAGVAAADTLRRFAERRRA